MQEKHRLGLFCAKEFEIKGVYMFACMHACGRKYVHLCVHMSVHTCGDQRSEINLGCHSSGALHIIYLFMARGLFTESWSSQTRVG